MTPHETLEKWIADAELRIKSYKDANPKEDQERTGFYLHARVVFTEPENRIIILAKALQSALKVLEEKDEALEFYAHSDSWKPPFMAQELHEINVMKKRTVPQEFEKYMGGRAQWKHYDARRRLEVLLKLSKKFQFILDDDELNKEIDQLPERFEKMLETAWRLENQDRKDWHNKK